MSDAAGSEGHVHTSPERKERLEFSAASSPPTSAATPASEGAGSAKTNELRRDLLISGLSARDSRSLRRALARASIVVDTGLEEEGAVHVPVSMNSQAPLRGSLALVHAWALRHRFTQIAVTYGLSAYLLEVHGREVSPAAASRGPLDPDRHADRERHDSAVEV